MKSIKLKKLIAMTIIATTVAVNMPLGINSNVAFAIDVTYTDVNAAAADGFVVQLINNDTEYQITGFDKLKTGAITIPSQIDGKSVTSIGYEAFASCRGLTSINIPSGVTSIGLQAFFNCSELISINIPSSVTSIGDCAFYGCRVLTSIYIPIGVTSISYGAFFGCSGLTSIYIPSGVTSIGEGAFEIIDNNATFYVPNDAVEDLLKLKGYPTSGTNQKIVKISFNLIYDENSSTEGSVPIDSTKYTSAQTVTVANNTGNLVRTGYIFDGWNTAADGTGTDYAVGTTLNIEGDTTLYAKWKKDLIDTWDKLNAAVSNVRDNTPTTIEIDADIEANGECISIRSNKDITIQNAPGNSYSIKRGSGNTNKNLLKVSSKLTFKNITIDGNNIETTNCNLIYLYYNGGELILDNGAIIQNVNGNGGYGQSGCIDMSGNAKLTMKDGSTVRNIKSDTYAVNADVSSIITVSGNVQITGNTKKDGITPANVFLPNGVTISTGDSVLDTTSRIGVSTQSRPDGGDKINITGTNISDYSPNFISDNSNYLIINDSNVIRLISKNSIPSITTQPTDQTVTEGNNTSFQVEASGTGLTYQWQVNTTGTGSGYVNIANGGVYSGATTETLNITGATAEMNGYLYRVVVNGAVQLPATSNGAKLTYIPVSTAPSENDITVTNNTGASDKVEVINLAEGTTVKVYDAATDGSEIGSAIAGADGKVTINASLASLGGRVYVTIQETGKTESTPRTEKSFAAESLPVSTAPSENDITVTNNTGASDTIEVKNVPVGTTVKVYDAATEGSEIGSAIAGADGTVTITYDLGAGSGSVYVTIQETGKTESTPRTGKSYVAEGLPAPTKVVLAEGSLGTAGDNKITGLTSGSKYKIKMNNFTKYVKADGTLSDSSADAAELIGTEIIGLVNGTTYYVQELTDKPEMPKVNSVTITPSTANIAQGGSKQLEASVSVTGGAAQTVTWISDDSSNVVVDENGLVSVASDAILGMTATIKATSTVDTSKYGISQITVTSPDNKPTPDESETILKIRGTERVGNTLNAELLTQSGNQVTTSSAVTYNWYRDSSADSENGELVGTNKTYSLVGADKGSYIRLVVEYDNNIFKAITGRISRKSSSSSSSSSSNSNKNTSKTEEIKVNVTDGSSNNSVSQVKIERTTASDGTKKDTVNYTESKAQETVEQLAKEGKDIARIVITDPKNEVSETKVNIPKETISTLAGGNVNLEISTENARISLPKQIVEDLAQNENKDLYFRLIPINDEAKKREIQGNANREAIIQVALGSASVQALGKPIAIETNMSQRQVNVTLPLKNINIPIDIESRQVFLNDLGIYIEHSDGTKEFVKGETVEYEAGIYGIKFTVTKFSNFTIVKLNQQGERWQNTEQGWKYIVNGQPTVGWKQVNGAWYLMDSTGIMKTGWKQDKGTWYLLRDNGEMATGWQKVDGQWYYLYEDGSMASDTTINGYALDSNGAWIK